MRQYQNAPNHVRENYRLNHVNQTLAHVKEMISTHCQFNKGSYDIRELIELQNKIVDESDPDFDNRQILHAYQTAEACRKIFPDQDWMHLVGLLHDCGKVLMLKQFGGLPSWSVVGDIFPVGCAHSNSIVFSEFFKENSDKYDKLGIYEERCGLDNILMSFSHDYYLYCVLKNSECLIPEDGLRVIRYHSFYSWHNEGEYEYFMNTNDYKLRDLCKKFSQCDLYSKSSKEINIDEIKNYYEGLIIKYFPNIILF